MLATILAQQSAEVAAGASLAVIVIVVLVACAVISVIPCWILSTKGYDGSAMFGMFMLSFFCSWPIGLCVALIMPDKRQLQGQVPMRSRRAPPVMTRRRRQQIAEAEAFQNTAAAPTAPALPAGFLQCPRCGQQSNAALSACWNCKLPFHSAMILPAPPAAHVAPAPYAAPFRTPAANDNDGSMESEVSVGMAQFSSVPESGEPTPIMGAPAATSLPDPDATPILGTTTPAGLAAREIKVRCKACRKKFGGTVAQIAALRACPRCKATPFESVSAEAGT